MALTNSYDNLRFQGVNRFSLEVTEAGDAYSEGALAYLNEVSGLDATYDVIEYRAGDDSRLSPHKFPGLMKYGDITLKRGVTTGDNRFFQWVTGSLNGGEAQKIKKLTITLWSNDGQTPVAIWKVDNAWVSKYEGPSFNSSSSEVAFESVTLCHEGLVRADEGGAAEAPAAEATEGSATAI